ncbi:MAG TPA: transcriptional regulator [Pantoea sp.]|uniref:transcriptional regulator n=1 Tax=Pantoea piersonii TaxID=2364647 RepID=UPI000EC78A9D|nr:transcriptional regulator [Pantoea piersonii]HCW97862.1 transcriptional regulator [Pantoea sp.]
MRDNNLSSYEDNVRRVLAVVGCESAPVNATPENISRDRLLRAQAGLCHLLTDIIPNTSSERLREEIYLWVSEIHSLTRAEECDAQREIQALEEKS